MASDETFSSMENEPGAENTVAAQQWLADRHHKLNHYINGAWVGPSSAKYIETIGPERGELLAKVADGTAKDTDRAVAAAVAAQPGWVSLDGGERARYLDTIAWQVEKHSGLFSELENLENGKPVKESSDVDVPLVSHHFHLRADWAKAVDGEFPGFESPGVVSQIIPRDFPLLTVSRKLAPALAMGSTVILKPNEFAAATAVLLAQICHEVELPNGVFNLLLGDSKAEKLLEVHPDVKKIEFQARPGLER